ncbi:hypothetical protein [Streptomyces meridianus]|uniref:WD40 repeat domain-containing protein n=1 Tax=Streptomyces meridianus TaxID=2938945 RepID=A0ABT0X2T0_9ACTN|nr:hypothetical protein [Streptomyces meridianus]MCM2576847.1 hypothetical protein [Streptomyces meridianus]
MRSYLCLSVALLCAVLPAAGTAAAADGPSFTIEDRRITESSGLAASRAHPGIYWTHNDSDDGPYVYAVDGRSGRTVATVTLRGVDPRDVEAISVGPGGQVYVGDIGDNLGGTWPEVWIYRFREPAELKDTTVTPVRHTVRYDGGPRDAESLMVHPRTGRVYIVSKHQDGGGLYEGPAELVPNGGNTFLRKADVGLWATDAAFSPDGSRLVVRGYFEARMYRWRDGRITKLGEPALPMQRQGESVTFTSDGRALMYGTEGAGSVVTRVSLSGKLRPESVAREDKAREERARHAEDRDRGGSQEGGDALAGAATLAGLAVLAMAVRRMFRRGRG